MTQRRSPYRPPDLNRDHARPRSAPAPASPAVDARLTELISPLAFALGDECRRLGLRERVLALPVMAAVVLAMIWRRVPSVAELGRLLAREGLLWAPPAAVSPQALSLRLRCLPAELFHRVLADLQPTLAARAAARSRPLPPVVRRAVGRFACVWAVDGTTLEALFKKVGLLRGAEGAVLGGKLEAVLDLATKLPVALWLDGDAAANDKRFLERLQAVLPANALLVMDRGFYSFPFFDRLSDSGRWFVTRARSLAALEVERVLLDSPTARDRVVRLGAYRSNPCRRPVRLVEVQVRGTWRAYLTNVLDPQALSAADVVDLYGRRWKIEEASLLTKRLLGLSYLWAGAFNAVAMQVWATWLLYAALVDLTDAVAEELEQPLDALSLEMVYRGLYHFTVAFAKDQARDPVAYLAHPANRDLGVLKRRRKSRERTRLDLVALTANL
jgi:Transposase DDE domain